MTSPTHAGRAATSIDVVVESAAWAAEPAAETILRRAITTAAACVRAGPAACGEVSVVLTDDAAIRKLNRDWRNIDKPTNVLSFPARKLPARPARTACRGGIAPGEWPLDAMRGDREPDGPLVLLGDVVIAYETAAREAAAEDKPFAHHLAHLAVHGFLHLLGYDHDSDEDADEMEHLEAEILARLDVPDPYLTCAAGG
jgi:probable rRNA maturation factor